MYFRDSPPYIPGSLYKTTTFIKINNVSPLKNLINIMRQHNQASQNKNDTSYGECLVLFFRICRAHESTRRPAHVTQSTNRKIQQLMTNHTVRQCTCIPDADSDLSIKRAFYFRNHLFVLKYQKIPRRNSKRILQDMVKKK